MRFLPILAIAITDCVHALTIQIDYTYDTTNFFNTQPKRDAIEAVAKFYGNLIQDHLLRIDAAEYPGCSWTAKPTHPATGATISIPNLIVPADTIIVYVGARDLGGSTAGLAGPGGWAGSSTNPGWFPLLRARGSAGAANETQSLRTDFAPWGGSMAFDIDSTWNFSQSQNTSGTDFIPIALHEMGHVLGIGTADSWFNKISSTVFTGGASTRSYGSNPPLSGTGHFGGTGTTSRSFGSFNVTHGTTRQVLMLPTLIDDNKNLVVASDLDLAALVDIGWQISPQLVLNHTALSPAGASFAWNTSSFFDYKVQRGSDLISFPDGNASAAGNGGIRSWTDAAPPAARAFYRLSRTDVFPAPQNSPASLMAPARVFPTTDSEEPRVVAGCGHSGN
jgi:hypothetical protein